MKATDQNHPGKKPLPKGASTYESRLGHFGNPFMGMPPRSEMSGNVDVSPVLVPAMASSFKEKLAKRVIDGSRVCGFAASLPVANDQVLHLSPIIHNDMTH